MLKPRRGTQKRVWVFCDGSTGAMRTKEYHAATDGRSPMGRSPGAFTCGAAAVARADDGQILGWEWQDMPPMTNNDAEYAGLLLGLNLARRLRAREVIMVLDSEVVVGQMTGRFAVNSPALRRWHWRACEAVRDFPDVRFLAVPRELNRLADGLACQAGISWQWMRQQMLDTPAMSK